MPPIQLAFDPSEKHSTRTVPEWPAASLAADGDPTADSVRDLLAWSCAVRGITGALVTRTGGTLRGTTCELPEHSRALLPFMAMHAEHVSRSHASRAPYGIEVEDERGHKLLAVKLKGGHLCATAPSSVELSDLIDRVKSWKPRRQS